jgi:DNA-binding CsgD family transcriptional regulator
LQTAQILELVQQYVAGSSVPQLAEQFNINRTTVLNHLERRGVPRRANLRKLTDEDIAEACRLYQEGRSTKQLGPQFGVDPETVRKALHKKGLRMRSRRFSSPPR